MAHTMKSERNMESTFLEEEPFLEHVPIKASRRSPLSLLKNFICPFILGAGVASLIFSVIGTIHRHHSASIQLPPAADCGLTPDEARAKGCHFQLWSYSWVPHHCFDADLQADFLRLHDQEGWQYLRNVSSVSAAGKTEWVREEVPLSQVLEGERSGIYSTWGQHYWHCAFYLRRFFKATGGLTNRDRDFHHSVHCQEWLSDPFAHHWETPNIILQVGYHECDVANALRVLDEEQVVRLRIRQSLSGQYM